MFYSRNVKKGVLLCFSRVAPPVNDYCDDDYDVGDSTDNTCLQGHICGGGLANPSLIQPTPIFDDDIFLPFYYFFSSRTSKFRHFYGAVDAVRNIDSL